MKSPLILLSLAAAGLTYLALKFPRAYSKAALTLLALVVTAMLMLYAWRDGFAAGGILVAAQGAHQSDEGSIEMTKYMLRLDESIHNAYVTGFVFISYMLLLLVVSRLKRLPQKS